MGKSPGKWIKTVLLGKKNSKSKFPHGKEKPANGKEVHVRVMAPETGIDDDPQEVHSGGLSAVHVDEHISSSEYQEASIQQDQEVSAPRGQSADVEQTRELDMFTDAERITREKAATKTQAAFRGYLARRAFKALRGIIRLQALIRGHLVRRQAVATLHCIIGIVKLQALVRGSRIRCSNAGIEVQRVCFMKPLDVTTRFNGDAVSTGTAGLTANSFIRKLLALSPEGMPLRVPYDDTESNSVQIWLERWSILCPWKPASPPMKASNSKIQKKQGNSQLQAAEGEIVRPKHSVRRVPSIFDNTSAQPTSESEKPRRNQKKVTSRPADSVQENPQNELEKVKRSLRKVQSPVIESSASSEVTEMPPQSQVKATTSSMHEVPFPNEVKQVENMKEEFSSILKEETLTANEEYCQENTEDAIEPSQSVEISNGEITMVKSEPFEGDEKDESTPVPNGELKLTGESVLSENHETCERVSLPVKQENADDSLQNTPKIPSYMQATKSAKAKLRAQGSPRVNQDSTEKNNIMRRHSLPTPANGKVNSVSPRTPKALQGSGKGRNKNDKSLLSSRDGIAKGTQGWRR
ncbi:hypothetical protein RND81_13G120900 [Saponaria officinalis]|uniref:DUF4005 domain-containing protein n=1 Tax=Saponaria officinalis TaxID=3572 RepID=A0AAW1GYZ3_SAPOF